MLALALWSCLAVEPSGASLGPSAPRSVVIEDAQGEVVASVRLRPDEVTRVPLPPGDYAVRDEAGPNPAAADPAASQGTRTFSVAEGKTTSVAVRGQLAAPPPSDEAPTEPGPSEARLPTPASRPAPPPSDTTEPPAWRRWGAPLLSALIPGLGQAVNQQPGKAAGALLGTAGLAAAAILVRPNDGVGSTGALEPGTLPRSRAAGLAGFGVLVHAAAALYVAQILDAHAGARRTPVTPARDARVRVELGRTQTVAMAAGDDDVALYGSTQFAVLARVSRRVSIGVGDLGLHVATDDGARETTALRGGLRSMVRLLDTRPRWMSRAGTPSRLWLLAGGGATLQTTVRAQDVPAIRPEGPAAADAQTHTALTLYALAEAHYFLLDRWSLGLAPRVSVPLGTRHFAGGRALPRYAPTFELGLSLGVWL